MDNGDPTHAGRYTYVGNNPTNFFDPLGLQTTQEIVTSCPDDGPLICGFINDDSEQNSFHDNLQRFVGALFDGIKREANRRKDETIEDVEDIASSTLSCAAQETGIGTLISAGVAASGANVISTRGKFSSPTPRSSIASVAARRLAGNAKLPGSTKLPAPTANKPFATSARVGTVGRRLTPLAGQVFLAVDVVNTFRCVATGKGK